jgi:hypothetical protein
MDTASTYNGISPRTINEKEMIRLFDSLMQKDNNEQFTEAIKLMLDKWEMLGFESAVSAVRLIVNNFDQDPD